MSFQPSFNPISIDHRQPTRNVLTVAKLVPTAPTTEFSNPGWLQEATITNPTGGAISVALYDGNNIYLFPNVSLSSGAMLSYNGYAWFNNGLVWVATGAGLCGRLRFQQ